MVSAKRRAMLFDLDSFTKVLYYRVSWHESRSLLLKLILQVLFVYARMVKRYRERKQLFGNIQNIGRKIYLP